MKQVIFLLIVIIVSIACQNLNRHTESGYSKENLKNAPSLKISSKEKYNFENEDLKKVLPTKVRLKQLENALSTPKELEQYSKALPWFKNELEKIEFLSQKNTESRQKWLNDRNFYKRSQALQSNLKEVIDAQDISLGMPQPLVQKSWGEPDAVEVSGVPQFKNERWRYHRFISTPDGYKAEKKIVYFEGGRVVAWEIE